jgi:cyclohexadienyl dehydratase
VGSSGDYPPFSERTASGAWRGFDVEVARAWARDRGRRLEIVPVRWPDLEEALARGDFDVAMSGVTVRADRLVAGRFTAAVARTQAVLAARRGGAAPRRVGVNRGGHLERVARATLPGVELVPVDHNRLDELLASGAVDGVVTEALELRALAAGELVVVHTLADDRKAYFLRADAGPLADDLDAWLAARERDGWLGALRQRVLGDGAPSPPPASVARVIDLLARRLMLMPWVAGAKRVAGLPVIDPEREAEVETRAVARAGGAGLAPEPYRVLVRAQITAARAVQEATDAAQPVASLAALRAAIDRVDEALLPALVDALPITTPADVVAAAIQRDAPVPGLADRVVRPLADALRALGRGPTTSRPVCRTALPGLPVSAKLVRTEDGPMAKAIWNGTMLAESDRCEVVEGNQYFPPDTVRREFLRDSKTHTTCPWKGVASYYDVVVNGETNRDAAWYYPDPKDAARNIAGYVAFWRGVQVEP